MDHPDREADVLGVVAPWSWPSRARDGLGAHPLEPEVGVADPESWARVSAASPIRR